MLDVNLIRVEPDAVREGIRKVGADPELVTQVLGADAAWRRAVESVEGLKARRNRESTRIGKMKDSAERQVLIEEMRRLGEQIRELDREVDDLRSKRDGLLLEMPNIPHEEAPVGKDETENVLVKAVGEKPAFDFEPKPHWVLGEELGILDFERGVKLSGSRFYVMINEGSRLQRALINWMLDLHVTKHGYTEVYPPFVVSEKCLVGTGNLPKFAENLYRDAEDDLWLIPTAEVPLTNMHREEILDAEQLPICYVAYTACFRREKMSAGKDVRGIKRGHQFDKVELMKYVRPEDSDREHEALVRDATDVCDELGLPYRIMEMCTGDLSFVACRKYDVELWAPGCDEWIEVSSCGNFRDFQARRASIRYRPAPGAAPQYVHTINGSALALPRLVIAILECFQQADGSVRVPEVLRPYMHGLETIERK